jgi:hypothetical protein
MKCSKCGAPSNTPGKVLVRTNPKGEAGIFECSPACNVTHISFENALVHALEESKPTVEQK